MRVILAILSLATLAGFFAIIVSFVPEPTLIAVMVIAVLLAAIDFARELMSKK